VSDFFYSASKPRPLEIPPCPRCGAAMMLTRIEPAELGFDIRNFECTACDYDEIRKVKYK